MNKPVTRFISLLVIASTALATPAFAAPVVGEAAPDFTATDTNGNTLKLSEQKDKIVVLEWKNPECPFVKKHYESNNMQTLQQTQTGKGVVWWSIQSSAEGKQGYMDAKGANEVAAKEKSHASAIILDPKGEIGKLYEAKTTPHMFVVGKDGKLAYMGAIDDKPTPDKADVVGAKNYVSAAIENIEAGKPVESSSTQPYGCGVKYAD